MSAASSRILRHHQVAGRSVPTGGRPSTSDLITYRSADGTRYAVEEEYAPAYERQARQARTGETAVFRLDAVIGKRRTSDGEIQYLALWAAPFDGPEDASWEPAHHFRASDIIRFEDEEAELDELDARIDACIRQQPEDVAMQDDTVDGQMSAAADSASEVHTAETNQSANGPMLGNEALKTTNPAEDEPDDFHEHTLEFPEGAMDLDDAKSELSTDRSYHNSVPPAGGVQFNLGIFAEPARPELFAGSPELSTTDSRP